MKKIILSIFLLISAQLSAQDADDFSLEKLQQDAIKNYPLLKQKGMMDAINELSLKNINTAWLPQFAVNGQATYQSAVPSIPIEIPHVKIPTLDKDHYQLTLDGQQTIYDGGITKTQAELQRINNDISKQQVEIELFKLKDRVNQLYFSILMTQQNDSQFRMMANDIQARIKNTESGVKNGTMLSNNLDMLRAELVNIDQKSIENSYLKKSCTEMLSILCGRKLSATATYKSTSYPLPTGSDTVSTRPELTLYDMQQKATFDQRNLIKTAELPRLYAFGQAGFGKPGLDYFSNDFKPFWIVGAKASWNISSFYTNKKSMDIQDLNAGMIRSQRATFDKNTAIQIRQQVTEIEKIQALMVKDNELITLRKRITQNTAVQMQDGVITATDYIIALDSEGQAELNLKTHELQLQLAITNYRNTLGR